MMTLRCGALRANAGAASKVLPAVRRRRLVIICGLTPRAAAFGDKDGPDSGGNPPHIACRPGALVHASSSPFFRGSRESRVGVAATRAGCDARRAWLS